jgi:hypothetical protein
MVRFGMMVCVFCSDDREVSVVEGSVHREQPPPPPPPPSTLLCSLFSLWLTAEF